MLSKSSLTRLTASVRPRHLKTAALFTGGAVTGMIVWGTASYLLVSALFPHSMAPSAQASEAPAPSLATFSPLAADAGEDAATGLATTPTPIARVTSLGGIVALPRTPESPPLRLASINPDAIVAPPAAAVAPIAALELTPQVAPVPEPAPAAIVDLNIGRPAMVPPTRPGDMARAFAAVTAGLPNRAVARPAARPEGIGATMPATFAALSAGDAAGRSSATIGYASPRPRPERLAAAEPTDTDLTDAIPGLRPQPRPEALRVASTEAPAPGTIGTDTCGRDLARAMPSRRSNAESGSQFLAGLTAAGGSNRDTRIIDEIARGNVPTFLRELHPVTFQGADGRGIETEIVVCVTPDYLALGSDDDFVRVPLGLPAAARIAGQFDMTLPTPHMVDAIYAQADVQLSPSPMTPGPQMSSTGYLVRHNATIEGQRDGKPGLISGHKKDVVMASRMARSPGRVAIYGWHRLSGKPIQPVSTVHGASYADYSHGIRLVSKTAYLNGRAVDLDELLASNRYASLINSDGPMPGGVIRIASR